MIPRGSPQVMASLAEREALKGQVRATCIDPPYCFRFQCSTISRDVKDGKLRHLTREPERPKAFCDDSLDGIHCSLMEASNRPIRPNDKGSGSCYA